MRFETHFALCIPRRGSRIKMSHEYRLSVDTSKNIVKLSRLDPALCRIFGAHWGVHTRMIDESVIKTVIERTDIVRLVNEYVPLRSKSGRMWGCCPFHHEKTPSFTVNPDRGIFYCFGCHEGGNAAKFLMKLEGISFPEAIERLAERLGMEVHSEETNAHEMDVRAIEKKRRASFFELNRLALSYFEQAYASDGGQPCRRYAESRGITPEIQKLFHLGYAPDSWDGLVEVLTRARVSMEDARALGLIASRHDSEGYYARFRNRFMFPVMSARGDTIAFSGRTLEQGEVAKYINSPESPIYTKGEHLFGLYQAKNHISREHCAILVEGNVDAVMMHCYGFCHTVASLGTALTAKQVELLFRHTKTVYLMYDGDEAGQKAMMRALPLLLARGFEGLFAVQLPRQEDPDSFLKMYGAEGMKSLLEAAQPLGAWCIEQKCRQIQSVVPELRKKSYSELSELIEEFPDAIAQRHYLDEAARQLGVDMRKLAQELGIRIDDVALPTRSRGESSSESQKIGAYQPVSIEAIVAQMLLTSDKRCKSFFDESLIELIQDDGLRRLLSEFSALEDRSEYGIEHRLSEEALKAYYRIICSKVETPKDEHGKDLWYQGALASLFCDWAQKERYQLACDIAESVKNGDSETLQSLVERDKSLLKLIEASFKYRRLTFDEANTETQRLVHT